MTEHRFFHFLLYVLIVSARIFLLPITAIPARQLWVYGGFGGAERG